MLSYIIKDNNLTVFINGKSHAVTRDNHPLFDDLVEAINNGNEQFVSDNIELKKSITNNEVFQSGRITITNDGNILFNNDIISSALTKKIMACYREKLPFKPLVKFLDNLMDNPSYASIQELILFLDSNNLPITDDGHLLAYKSVRTDFLDHHTGTMDNSVGKIVSMPRGEVNDDRKVTCSSGLHFASLSYITSAYGSQKPIVILKINPRDVVSIPNDYNNSKGRCCRYEVVGLHLDGSRDTLSETEFRHYDSVEDDEYESLDDYFEVDEDKFDEDTSVEDESLESDTLDAEEVEEVVDAGVPERYTLKYNVSGLLFDGKYYDLKSMPVVVNLFTPVPVSDPEALVDKEQLQEAIYNSRYNGNRTRLVKATYPLSDLVISDYDESMLTTQKGLTFTLSAGVLSIAKYEV